jgi:hypothetical protein
VFGAVRVQSGERVRDPPAHPRARARRQQPPSGNALALHLDGGSPGARRSGRWRGTVLVAAAVDPFLLCDLAVAAAAAISGARRAACLRCSCLGVLAAGACV